MNYFALQKRVEVGSPPHIKGLLHQSAIDNGANIAPAYPWYWVEPGQTLQPLPPKLFLHTKDPLYRFDIRSGNSLGEFFVSDQMLDAMRCNLMQGDQISRIEIVSRCAAPLASKPYFYLRLGKSRFLQETIIDTGTSKLERRRTGEIKKVASLTLASIALPSFFMVSEPSIARVLFFSSDLREQCIQWGAVGVEFVACSQIGSLNRI